MSFEKISHELLTASLTFVQSLFPAAIGAAVSQAYKKGLSWGERLIQSAVGICVSVFVTNAVGSIWEPNKFVEQGLGFVFGMIAFEAVPGFIRSATDAVAKLPEWVSSWLPKKPGGK